MAGNHEVGGGEAAAPRRGTGGGEGACAPAPTPAG